MDEQLGNKRDVLASQQCKLVDLQDRSRRNNLIVFGIPEAPGETNDDLIAEVLTGMFEKRLGGSVKTIERIHRLGKKCEDKTRPVLCGSFTLMKRLRYLRIAAS